MTFVLWLVLQDDVAKLLEQLDSDGIETREQAEERLVELRAADGVEKAWRAATGERREKLERILRRIDLLDLPELDADALKKRLDARTEEEQWRLWFEVSKVRLRRASFKRLVAEMVCRLPGKAEDPRESEFLESLARFESRLPGLDPTLLVDLVRRHLARRGAGTIWALWVAGRQPEVGRQLVDQIAPYIGDKDYNTAACVAASRGRLKDLVPALMKQLEQGDDKELSIVQSALYMIRDRTIAGEVLRIAKEGKSEQKKYLATLLLGWLECSEAVPFLIDRVKKGERNLANGAVFALGKLRARGAVAILLERAGDLYGCTDALGEIGDPAAIEGLVRLARENEKVAGGAIFAIGRIGGPESRKTLLVLAEDEQLRWSTIRAMGYFWSKDYEPSCLKALLDRKEEVRLEARRVLESRGSADLATDILKLAKADRPDAFAVRFVARHKVKEASQLLPGLLSSDDPHVVAAAIDLAAALDFATAIPRIKELMREGNPEIVLAAGRALSLFGKFSNRTRVRQLLASEDEDLRGRALRQLLSVGDETALAYLDRLDLNERGEASRAFAGLNRWKSEVGRRLDSVRFAESVWSPTVKDLARVIEEIAGARVRIDDPGDRLWSTRVEAGETVGGFLDRWTSNSGFSWIAEDDGTLRILWYDEAVEFWYCWLNGRKK